jgi:hypothetical protein
VVCRWRGFQSQTGRGALAACQNETDTYTFEVGSDLDVQRDVELPIASPHGVAWRDLPPLDVHVLGLPAKEFTSALGTALSEAGAEEGSRGAAGEGERSSGAAANDRTERSLLLPEARAMWSGSLSLERAVQSTSSAGRVLALDLSPSRSTLGGCEIMVEVVLRRRPQCPGWSKIMHIVAAKGASPFFTARLDRLLHSVESRADEFCSKMRAKRLEVMSSLNARSNYQRIQEHNVGLGAAHSAPLAVEYVQENGRSLQVDGGGGDLQQPAPHNESRDQYGARPAAPRLEGPAIGEAKRKLKQKS